MRKDVAKLTSELALLATSSLDVTLGFDGEPIAVAIEDAPAVPLRGPRLFLKHCVF